MAWLRGIRAGRSRGKPQGASRGWGPVRLGLIAAALLLLPALALPPAGAGHVPPAATIAEVPRAEGGSEWVCFGGIFASKRLQVGQSCEFWCITDGNCALFMKDLDYLSDRPFEIEFTTWEGAKVRRGANAEGYVCISWWELGDLHFVFHPLPYAPATLSHFFAVKDEGQFCPW